MLSSAYFAETKLVETIQTIKKELKREKAAKIARQVLELFESNCKFSGSDRIDEDEAGDSNRGEKRRRKAKDSGHNRDAGDQVQSTPDASVALATSEHSQPTLSTNETSTNCDTESASQTPASGGELAATGGSVTTKGGHLDPMAQIEVCVSILTSRMFFSYCPI